MLQFSFNSLTNTSSKENTIDLLLPEEDGPLYYWINSDFSIWHNGKLFYDYAGVFFPILSLAFGLNKWLQGDKNTDYYLDDAVSHIAILRKNNNYFLVGDPSDPDDRIEKIVSLQEIKEAHLKLINELSLSMNNTFNIKNGNFDMTHFLS